MSARAALVTYSVPVGKTRYLIEADPASRVADRLKMGLPYEHKLLAHIGQQKYKGVAVDVGAHIGNHALYLAALGLRVMAFEPLHFGALMGNIKLNPELSITPYSCALGDRKGWVRPVGFAHQTAPERWGDVELGGCSKDTPGAVPMEPLDAFFIKDVSLIKIDVEGMEVAVLRGARDTLADWHPDVFIEARDRAAHDAIVEELEPLGYRYVLTAATSTPMEQWSYQPKV